MQELLFFPRRLLFKIFTKLKNEGNKANPQSDPQPSPSRRHFLATSGAIALGTAAFAALRNLGVKISAVFFRPPGTPDELTLLSRCARCGKCIDVCPSKILQPIGFIEAVNSGASPIQASLLIGTPRMNFDSGYCEETCVKCSKACPTQALFPLEVEDKKKQPIALAVFNLEKCLLYHERECSICRRECPYQAIKFQWSDDAYANIPAIDNSICVGCGRCVLFCPGEPIDDFEEENETEEQSPSLPTRREKALSLVQRPRM